MPTLYFDMSPACHPVIHKMDELGLRMNVDVMFVPTFPGSPEEKEMRDKGGAAPPFLVDEGKNYSGAEEICAFLEDLAQRLGKKPF